MSTLRILIAGHDWGGLNILAPLLRAWGTDPRFHVEFIGTPVTRRDLAFLVPTLRFPSGIEALTDWVAPRGADLDVVLDHVLDKGQYDVLLCSTSAHAILERRLIAAANVRGIPSVAFCDMWWAYAERFHDGSNWTLPDRLWVIDETMRVAADSIDWPRPLPIDVIGSPLFADLSRRRADRGEGVGRAVRFVSEPASTKFPEARIDEFALAEMLVDAMRAANCELPMVVRPHPAESTEAWRRWCFARRHLNVEFDTLPLSEAIADSKLAVGISSILLSEMRMCGVPTASLQPPGANPSYYCLPFDELQIEVLPGHDELGHWLNATHQSGLPPTETEHSQAIPKATELLLKLAKFPSGAAA